MIDLIEDLRNLERLVGNLKSEEIADIAYRARAEIERMWAALNLAKEDLKRAVAEIDRVISLSCPDEQLGSKKKAGL
jgi:hypothetical protein